MPFNLFFKSELRYCNQFWNTSTTNQDLSPISPVLVSMKYQVIKPVHTPTNTENLVKIGPVDSEIRGLEPDH